MSDDTVLSRIETKLDTVSESVGGIKVDVAVLKTGMAGIPGEIDSAVKAHTLDCINRKAKRASIPPVLNGKAKTAALGTTIAGVVYGVIELIRYLSQ